MINIISFLPIKPKLYYTISRNADCCLQWYVRSESVFHIIKFQNKLWKVKNVIYSARWVLIAWNHDFYCRCSDGQVLRPFHECFGTGTWYFLSMLKWNIRNSPPHTWAMANEQCQLNYDKTISQNIWYLTPMFLKLVLIYYYTLLMHCHVWKELAKCLNRMALKYKKVCESRRVSILALYVSSCANSPTATVGVVDIERISDTIMRFLQFFQYDHQNL